MRLILFRILFMLGGVLVWPVQAENAFIELQRQTQQKVHQQLNTLTRHLNNGKPPPQARPSSDLSSVPRLRNRVYPDGERDPFAVPEMLLAKIAANRNMKNSGNTLVTHSFSRTSVSKMPKIKLKGVLHRGKSKSPLAIVELNKQTYMVREGDELSFNPVNLSQVIKIRKINRLSLLIEVGTLGELVVVR